MYESKMLDDYMKSEDPPVGTDKDKEISQTIGEIDRLKDVYSVLSILQPIAFAMLSCWPVTFLFQPKGAMGFVPIMSVLVGFPLILLLIGECRAVNSKKKLSLELQNLFHLLSDKPYEVRIKWDKTSEKKLKVMVEENVVVDSHVLKEKSKHFTAYIDHKADTKSIVKFMAMLVKEAETRFK